MTTDEIIEYLLAMQSKRLLESDVLKCLPPTQKCFHDNLMAMYRKGMKDIISALESKVICVIVLLVAIIVCLVACNILQSMTKDLLKQRIEILEMRY